MTGGIMGRALALGCLAAALGMAAAHGQVVSGLPKHDNSARLEFEADDIFVDTSRNLVELSVGAKIKQGEFTMTSDDLILLEFTAETEPEGRRIKRLIARGDVKVAYGAARIQARSAEYTLESGILTLDENVKVESGGNSVSGGKFTLDFNAGTGFIEGRARTTLELGERDE